MAQPT
jgi:hypothetical protein